MKTYKPSHIQQVKTVILNTRDFCGNEMEAGMEMCRELGFTKGDATRLYRAANFLANAEWNEFQKAAGVNPKYTF